MHFSVSRFPELDVQDPRSAKQVLHNVAASGRSTAQNKQTADLPGVHRRCPLLAVWSTSHCSSSRSAVECASTKNLESDESRNTQGVVQAPLSCVMRSSRDISVRAAVRWESEGTEDMPEFRWSVNSRTHGRCGATVSNGQC